MQNTCPLVTTTSIGANADMMFFSEPESKEQLTDEFVDEIAEELADS